MKFALLLLLHFVTFTSCSKRNTILSEHKTADIGREDTTFDGIGEFDESGQSIFGRKVLYRNYHQLPLTENGTISVKVCINREGSVTYAELMKEGTTITDRSTLKQAIVAAKGYTFEPDLKAPQAQCGKLSFSFNGDPIPSNRDH